MPRAVSSIREALRDSAGPDSQLHGTLSLAYLSKVLGVRMFWEPAFLTFKYIKFICPIHAFIPGPTPIFAELAVEGLAHWDSCWLWGNTERTN